MSNLMQDVSTLTNISENTLRKLNEIIRYCIYQNFLEDVLEDNEMTSLDLGIGTLYIKNDTELKFKFVPSDSFKKDLLNTKEKKLNLLEGKVSLKLNSKLLDVYQYLC